MALANQGKEQDWHPSIYEPYLQARLLQSLLNDRGDSFIDLTICNDPPQHRNDAKTEAEAEANPISTAFNIEKTSAVQERLSTDAQLQRAIDLNVKVTYLITIRQPNSRSRLCISPSLLASLIDHCRFSLKLYDFLTFFGPRHGESSLSPPPTWTKINLLANQLQHSVCVYALRFPESHGRTESTPYTIRQCLIYHQWATATPASFILHTGTALSVQKWLSSQAAAQNLHAAPFSALHLKLLHVAVSAWRPYISHLSEQIYEQSNRAITADFDDDGLDQATLETRQFLKQLEDNLAEVVLNINHARKTARVLQQYCLTISQNLPSMVAENTDWNEELRQHADSFDCIVDSFNHYLEQSEALKHKVKSTSDLVSNILELNNSNTLKLLAIRAADESAIMQELTKKATQDAAAVKILTVLTLIYLPSTVVLNFFSTSFVNTATSPTGRSVLTVTSNWWIAIAATVPLTIITLYIWWFYVQKELKGEWPVTWKACKNMASELRLRLSLMRHRNRSVTIPPSWDASLIGSRARQSEMQDLPS